MEDDTVDEVPGDVDSSYNCDSDSDLRAQEKDDCDNQLVRDPVAHDDHMHDIDEEPDTAVDQQPDQFDAEVQPLCQISLFLSVHQETATDPVITSSPTSQCESFRPLEATNHHNRDPLEYLVRWFTVLFTRLSIVSISPIQLSMQY